MIEFQPAIHLLAILELPPAQHQVGGCSTRSKLYKVEDHLLSQHKGTRRPSTSLNLT